MPTDAHDVDSEVSSVSSTRERRLDSGDFHAAEKLDDWATHYPFPQFKHRRRLSDDEGEEEELLLHGGSSAHNRRMDDEQSSGDDNDDPLPVINAHTLSSDWNLETSNFDLSRMCHENVAHRMPISPTSHHSVKQVFSAEEVTALTSLVDLRHPSNGTIKLQHVDLSWMCRRQNGRIVAPPVHLCLANINAAIDAGGIVPSQILINSPRSALLLIRKGIQLKELMRRPWAEKRHKHQANFGSASDLCIEDRRELAAEKSRQRLLDLLENEYDAIVEETDFDDIVKFCKGYRPERPCSALDDIVQFRKGCRPNSTMSLQDRSSIVHRSNHETRVERTRHVLTQKSENLEAKRTSLLDKIRQRDELIQRRLQAQQEICHSNKVKSHAREETWFVKHNHSQTVQNFKKIVTHERSRYRFDQAVRQQEEDTSKAMEFTDHVRKQRSLELALRASQRMALQQKSTLAASQELSQSRTSDGSRKLGPKK